MGIKEQTLVQSQTMKTLWTFFYRLFKHVWVQSVMKTNLENFSMSSLPHFNQEVCLPLRVTLLKSHQGHSATMHNESRVFLSSEEYFKMPKVLEMML